MKVKFFSIIAIALFVYGCASLTGMGTSGAATGGNTQEDIKSGDAQIENLISQMTIEEKVGQMTQQKKAIGTKNEKRHKPRKQAVFIVTPTYAKYLTRLFSYTDRCFTTWSILQLLVVCCVLANCCQ